MIKIHQLETRAPEGITKKEAKKELKELQERIFELTNTLAIGMKHSLLVVLQGMDSSGKDGVMKNVFNRITPIYMNVKGYKKPTEEEFSHDFLWRVTRHAPAKGKVQLFIRSHYEDILIQRVHGWIDEDRVDARINAINAWEDLLVKDNGTTILKFFLNLSKDRQEEKLQERIDIPEKNYKHNPGDWEERKHWDKYMKCYEDCLNRCNVVPWIPVPSDQRWYRNLFVARKVVEALEGLNMKMPTYSKEDLSKASD